MVYTPLCGVGLSTVGDVLTAIGFPMLTPTDERPDGSFAVIPFRSPNPEVPQSTEPARAFADRHGSGMVLSSDPDADRVGCEIKLPDGREAVVPLRRQPDRRHPDLRADAGSRRAPAQRAWSSRPWSPPSCSGKIVAARGESDLIDDLLVGFKYVADVLKRLGRDGRYRDVQRRPEELVLAAEESHGVIALPHILDKDATPACMYLAGLYQRLAAEGRTLLDYYTGILEQLGGFDTVNRSIMMAGAGGMQRKDRIMAWLRQTPPAQLAGHAVTAVIDYWDEDRFGPLVSESERLPRNVVQLQTGRFVITVRPSGTEPKLKFYCQLLPDPAQRPGHGPRGRALLQAVLRGEAEAAAQAIYNDLVAPLGVKLGAGAGADRPHRAGPQAGVRARHRAPPATGAGRRTDRRCRRSWWPGCAGRPRSCCRAPTPCPPCADRWAPVAAAWARELPALARGESAGELHRRGPAHERACPATERRAIQRRRVTVIGGGTGSYNLLVGMRPLDRLQLTSIVTMTDSGGDSGRLRTEFNVLPPGDLRRCLVALSNESPLLRELFNFRFDEEPLRGPPAGQPGDAGAGKILGSEREAIDALHRLLNIRGRVLPI